MQPVTVTPEQAARFVRQATAPVVHERTSDSITMDTFRAKNVTFNVGDKVFFDDTRWSYGTLYSIVDDFKGDIVFVLSHLDDNKGAGRSLLPIYARKGV